jgi:hypothetical protein
MMNGYMISIGAFQVFGCKNFSDAMKAHRKLKILTRLTLDDPGIVKGTVCI